MISGNDGDEGDDNDGDDCDDNTDDDDDDDTDTDDDDRDGNDDDEHTHTRAARGRTRVGDFTGNAREACKTTMSMTRTLPFCFSKAIALFSPMQKEASNQYVIDTMHRTKQHNSPSTQVEDFTGSAR